MVANNIIAGLLTMFLGSFGDLISRIMFLNCSIDKSWSMLFFLPPLSFISAGMHFLNKIEKSELSCGTIFDLYFIVIPVIAILINNLLPKLITNNDMLLNSVTFIIMLIIYAVIRIVKYNEKCKLMFNKYKGINNSLVARAFLTSFIVNSISILINIIAPYARMIPVLGIPFLIWDSIGNIPGGQTTIALVFAHLINNLNENNKSYMTSKCCKFDDNCCISNTNCPVDSEAK